MTNLQLLEYAGRCRLRTKDVAGEGRRHRKSLIYFLLRLSTIISGMVSLPKSERAAGQPDLPRSPGPKCQACHWHWLSFWENLSFWQVWHGGSSSGGGGGGATVSRRTLT